VTITFIITGLGLKPVDVVLVQDVSGSMGEDDTPSGHTRLEVAQAAAITFVNELTDTDRAAVVAYSNMARLVLSLTTDTDAAITVIDSLEPQGYTNIGDGIRAGHEELITSTRYHSKTVKAMLLLSDGNANRPEPDSIAAQHAISQAKMAGECGILIYTIGFGSEVSETLMRKLAALSGGEYYSSSNGADLETIYQEIALGLRNLVITDVLPLGVDLDCGLLLDMYNDWRCVTNAGVTTVTIPMSNSELVTNPLTLSFTATVNLDPKSKGPINVEGSETCYDGPVITPCQSFENPTATVGGRKIIGTVFEDRDHYGYFDEGENVLSDVVVTTSNGLISETDISGVYVFRTSAQPTLTVAISIPTNYFTTTSEITHILPLSGTYQWDFGLYRVITPPILLLGPADGVQVVRPGTEVTYVYTVSHTDPVATLNNVVVTDSHLGSIPPSPFDLPPGKTMKLTVAVPLTYNRTSTATVTGDVKGYSGMVSGGPATTTVHVIEGISLNQPYTQTPPTYRHGDLTTLYYSVTNRDVDDGVLDGIILVTDTLGRIITTTSFGNLDPNGASPLFSQTFTVPWDIVVTLTATAWDDIQKVLSTSDQVKLTLCPEDIYEPDNNVRDAYPIYPDEPQVRDFSGNEDWVGVRLHPGDRSLYTFTALPLGPNGVSICLTLDPGGVSLIDCNLDNPRYPVEVSRILSCTGGDACDYFLQIRSPSLANGCWTDYRLSVREVLRDDLERILLPAVLRSS